MALTHRDARHGGDVLLIRLSVVKSLTNKVFFGSRPSFFAGIVEDDCSLGRIDFK